MKRFVSVRNICHRGVVFLVLLAASPPAAQNYQPPFPRLAFQRPGGIGGGALEHFMAKFDFVVHGGAVDAYQTTRDLNLKIRELNPDVVIFGTSRQGIWPMNPLWPPQCFVYSDYFGTLTAEANPGDSFIKVNTTVKLLPNFGNNDAFALLGGDDWITFSGYTDTSLTGIPLNGDGAISRSHSIGDSLKRPVRFVGFGYLHNITPYAALIDTTPVWKHFIDVRFMPDKQDFTMFDGVFYDAFRFSFWGDDFNCGVDLDHNHINDLDERGLNWFNQQWADGVKKMLNYEHLKYKNLNPDKPSFIVANMGSAQEGYAVDYCEGMEWEGFMRFAYTCPELIRINKLWEAEHDTVFMIVEDYVDPGLRPNGKNDFTYMRYGLTASLISGAYYGRTYGNDYFLSLYYDEFETDLGYPLGPGQQIPGKTDVYVRFFDNGAAICNASANTVSVTAADIMGLPHYNGPYYRFQGGQASTFNNGQLFDSVTLFGETRTPPKKNKGDGIIMLTQPDTVITDIIVGNCFNNDTSPGSEKAVFSGGYWGPVYDKSYEKKLFDARNPCYSQWAANSGEEAVGYHYSHHSFGAGAATYTPTIGLAGYYEIAEWHPMVGETPEAYQEAPDVPFEIWVNGERKMAGIIDQTKNYGQWNPIAKLYLPGGKNSKVVLSNQGHGFMAADAIRFRYLKSVQPDTIPPVRPQGANFSR